jgi:hypothetical protein
MTISLDLQLPRVGGQLSPAGSSQQKQPLGSHKTLLKSYENSPSSSIKALEMDPTIPPQKEELRTNPNRTTTKKRFLSV